MASAPNGLRINTSLSILKWRPLLFGHDKNTAWGVLSTIDLGSIRIRLNYLVHRNGVFVAYPFYCMAYQSGTLTAGLFRAKQGHFQYVLLWIMTVWEEIENFVTDWATIPEQEQFRNSVDIGHYPDSERSSVDWIGQSFM